MGVVEQIAQNTNNMLQGLEDMVQEQLAQQTEELNQKAENQNTQQLTEENLTSGQYFTNIFQNIGFIQPQQQQQQEGFQGAKVELGNNEEQQGLQPVSFVNAWGQTTTLDFQNLKPQEANNINYEYQSEEEKANEDLYKNTTGNVIEDITGISKGQTGEGSILQPNTQQITEIEKKTSDFLEGLQHYSTAMQMYQYGLIPNDKLEKIKKFQAQLNEIQDNTEVQRALTVQKDLNKEAEQTASLQSRLELLKNKENKTPKDIEEINNLEKQIQTHQQLYLLNLYKFEAGVDESEKIDKIIKEQGVETAFKQYILPQVKQEGDLNKLVQKWQSKGEDYLKPLKDLQDQYNQIQYEQEKKYERDVVNVYTKTTFTKGYVLTKDEQKEIVDGMDNILKPYEDNVDFNDMKQKNGFFVGRKIVTDAFFQFADQITSGGGEFTKDTHNQIVQILNDPDFKKFSTAVLDELTKNADEYIDDKGNIDWVKISDFIQGKYGKTDAAESLARMYKKIDELKFKNKIQEVEYKQETAGLFGRGYYGLVKAGKKFFHKMDEKIDMLDVLGILRPGFDSKGTKTLFKQKGITGIKDFQQDPQTGKIIIKYKNGKEVKVNKDEVKYYISSDTYLKYLGDVKSFANNIKYNDEQEAQDSFKRTIDFLQSGLLNAIFKKGFSTSVDIAATILSLGASSLTEIPVIGKSLEGLDEAISLMKNSTVRTLSKAGMKIGENLLKDLPLNLVIDSNVNSDPSFGWYAVPNISIGLVEGLALRNAGKLGRAVAGVLDSVEGTVKKGEKLEDIAKKIQGKLIDDGVGFVTIDDILDTLNKTKGKINRFAKIDLAKKVEKNVVNFDMLSDAEKVNFINTKIITEKIKRGELTDEDVKSILKSVETKYGDAINNFRLQGLSDSDILIKLMNMEVNSLKNLDNLQAFSKIKAIIKNVKMELPEKVDNVLQTFEKAINKLSESGIAPEKIEGLKASLKELKSRIYTYQTLAFSDEGRQYVKNINDVFDNFKQKLSDLGVEIKIKPLEYQKLKGVEDILDPEKMAKIEEGILSGKKGNLWQDLMEVDETLKQVLGNDKYELYNSTMKIVKGVMNGTIKLDELPQNIRQGITKMIGMLGSVEPNKLDLVGAVSYLLNGLVKGELKGVKIPDDIRLIFKNMSDIFVGSLKSEIKNNLVSELIREVKGDILRLGGIEKLGVSDIRKYLPYVTEETAKKVINMIKKGDYKGMLKLMFENSFVENGLFGLSKLDKLEDIDYTLFKARGEVSTIYKRVSNLTDIYLSDMEELLNLEEGIYGSLALKNIETLRTLLGYGFYRKFIGDSKEAFDFIKDVDQVKFYTNNLDDEAKTIMQGVDAFGIATRIHSLSKVIDLIKDEEISAEELSKMIAANYIKHPMIAKTLVNKLSKDELGKLNKALNIAEARHTKGLKLLRELYDPEKGILLLEKEIDGRKITLQEVLSMIDPSITRLNYSYFRKSIHFASQDILKYLERNDPENFDKFMEIYITHVFNDGKILEQEVKYPFIQRFEAIAGEKWGVSGAEGFVKLYNDFKKELSKFLDDENLINDISSRWLTNVLNNTLIFTKRYDEILSKGFVGTVEDAYRLTLQSMVEKMLVSHLNDADIAEQVLIKNILENAYQNLLNNEKYSDMLYRRIYDLFAEGKYFKNEFRRVHTAQYNTNIVHLHYEILKSFDELAKLGVDGFKVPIDELSKVTSKFTRERTALYKKYFDSLFGEENIWDKIGTLFNPLAYDNVNTLFDYYLGLMRENKDKLVKVIGENKYNMIENEIMLLKEKGYTKGFDDFMKSEIDRKWSSVVEEINPEDILADRISSDQVFQEFVDTINYYKNYMIDKNAASIEFINEVFSPDVQDAIHKVVGVFSDMQKIIEESKNGQFKISKLLSDGFFDYLWKKEGKEIKPFKLIEKGHEGYFIKKNELGKTSIEQIKTYNLIFNDVELQYQKNALGILRGITNYLVNLQSATKYDPELVEILDRSSRWKGFNIPIDSIPALQRILAKAGVNVENFTHVNSYKAIGQIVAALEEFVKAGKVKAVDIANDIVTWYKNKYVLKNFSFPEKVIDEVRGQNYKDLIDAYTDILHVIRKKFTGGMFTVDELAEHINKAFQSFYQWGIGSNKYKELSSLHALMGNWIGTSVEDIAKIKDRMKYIYNEKLFHGYLFNSLADAFTSRLEGNLLDKVVGLFKGMEKFASSLMYGIFYSFPMGGAAASQQIIQNYIHNKAMRIAYSVLDVDQSNLEDLMDLYNKINTFSVGKAIRPEFMENVVDDTVIGGWKGLVRKVNSYIANGLRKFSALTYADAGFAKVVSEYGVLASMADLGFTKEGAANFLKNVNEVMGDYVKKGYDEVMPIEMMIKLNENRLSEYLVKRADELGWDKAKLDEVLKDMLDMKAKVEPLHNILKGAEMKAMTFFQLSKATGLHINQMLGKDGGRLFFRFVNWASKKAGEYANLLYRPLIAGDWQGVERFIREIVAEGIYVGKLYGIYDRIINGVTDNGDDINTYRLMMGMWLPAVVFNMTSMNLLDSFLTAAGVGDSLKLSEVKGTFTHRLFENLKKWMGGMMGRGGLPIYYWMGQYMKISNGLTLVENAAVDSETLKAYSGSFLQTLVTVLKEAALGRVDKFFLTRFNGIIFDNATSPTASIMSYLINEKIFTSQKLRSDVYDAYRALSEMIDNEDSGPIKEMLVTLLPYQIDLRPALLALDEYYKKKGLYGFYYGYNPVTIVNQLDELERMIDAKSLEDFVKENSWLAPQAEEQKMLKEYKLDKTTKIWTVVTTMLNPSLGNTRQKGLWRIGAGVDEEAFAQYQKDYQKVREIVSEAIYEYVGDDPDKIKKFKIGTIMFDEKIRDRVNEVVNKWGDGILLKATLTELRNAYKKILTERLKSKYGNIRNQAYYERYNQELRARELHTTAANYSIILAVNQEIGMTLANLYAKNDDDFPLKKQLTPTSSLGKYWRSKQFEEIAIRQGLYSDHISNIYTYMLDKILGGVTHKISKLKDEKKIQHYMDSFAKLANTVIDQIDKQYGPATAINVKSGIAAAMVDYLQDLVNYVPNLVKKMKDSFDRWLDIVHVSTDITVDDVVKDLTEEGKEEGGKKKKKVGIPRKPSARIPSVKMRQLRDKLNEGGRMYDNWRVATGRLPRLYGPDYTLRGGGLRGIRLPRIKAKKIKPKLDFIKLLQPEATRTIDLAVAKEKKVKTVTRYKPKKIKSAIKFTKKISRGRRR